MATQTAEFFEENIGQEETLDPTIITVSALAFDFDLTGTDPSKWADEIKMLIVKKRKPPKKACSTQPGGYGLPTGQLESKEDLFEALKRETRQESGCSVTQIISNLFVVRKTLKIDRKSVPNNLHVFLITASEPLGKVIETEEIDNSVECWIPLRQVFEMPVAQDKYGANRNPDGIFYSHRQRIYRAIVSMVFYPEELTDGEAIKKWLSPNRKYLKGAMTQLQKEGLLQQFESD